MFSYLKLASDSFGGVHKQYGPKRKRGRLFYPIYLVTWFIVLGNIELEIEMIWWYYPFVK